MRWNICEFILNVQPNFVSYCNGYHFILFLCFFFFLNWDDWKVPLKCIITRFLIIPKLLPNHPNYEDLRITFKLQKKFASVEQRNHHQCHLTSCWACEMWRNIGGKKMFYYVPSQFPVHFVILIDMSTFPWSKLHHHTKFEPKI